MVAKNCAYSKHVCFGTRKFIVDFNDDGEALRVKYWKPDTNGVLRQVTYRSGKRVASSGPKSIARRVIVQAKMKMASEDRNVDATP